MRAYYNDNDPYCCDWLQNLMDAGLIAPGRIDDRSIADVSPDDVRGYERCHFFAGIGGWDLALQLAGWPASRPVWTGSCPCQDFSVLGKRAGFAGDRDLWPEWSRLIAECAPDIMFGEQVDGAPEWLDRTAADLESLGYACGAIVIPAVAVGAQHERLRLYFVADSHAERRPDSQGREAAETAIGVRRSSGLAPCEAAWNFLRALIPDKDWIVDGLCGEGHAVAAYGNAIVPQVAAEFIRASMTP